MEIPTTETSENSTSLPVTTTETTETNETSDRITPPVIAPPQTTETSEPPPPPATNTPETEASLPEITNTQTTENLEQTPLPEVTNTHESETEPSDDSTPPPVTITTTQTTETMEQSVIPPVVTDNSHDNLVTSPENHQVIETRHETVEEEEEVRSVLKVIATTGKFCHDWEKLRSMLSLHLKQVISEYPQAKMTIEEQKSSLGETHAELAKRLDDALHSFVDGPPFTIQRLSEIILDAKSLYPNLSKLALALEKNLSVTSTLTMSTTPNGHDKVTEVPIPIPIPVPVPQLESDSVMENGVQQPVVDRDEIMTEVEADVSEVMTMDMETYEKSSEESSPMTTGDS